jgi:hypothetical protein
VKSFQRRKLSTPGTAGGHTGPLSSAKDPVVRLHLVGSRCDQVLYLLPKPDPAEPEAVPEFKFDQTRDE